MPFFLRIRHGGQQQLRVRMLRLRRDLHAVAPFHDMTDVHDRKVFRKIPGGRNVVRDVHERDVAVMLHGLHHVQNAEPDRDVQRGGRFVRQNNFRADGERFGDADALPLPAAQLIREFFRGLLRRCQANGLQRRVHGRFQILFMRDFIMNQQRAGDVVKHRMHRVQRAIRVLKNHLDFLTVRQHLSAAFERLNVLPFKEHRA